MLRQAQQFMALAATEGRFRTREQAAQLANFTERDRQQDRLVRLAGAGAALLAFWRCPVGRPCALSAA